LRPDSPRLNLWQVLINTGVRVKSESGAMTRADDVIIRDRADIVRHYFTSTFPQMMIPSFVYWAVTLVLLTSPSPPAGGVHTQLWIWWLASIPRVVSRALRLSQYFSSMDLNLNVKSSRLQGVKFVLIILMSAHWIGCLYFCAARVQPAGAKSWMDSIHTYFPEFEAGSPFDEAPTLGKYIFCLYKGMDGLVSLGYIPTVPTNTTEMLLGLAVQFVSIFVMAYILGTLVHYLLALQDPNKEAHVKRMEDLDRFMAERRLPIATRKRLQNYFQFQYRKASLGHGRISAISNNLPVSLFVKVANARYRPTLLKCCVLGQVCTCMWL